MIDLASKGSKRQPIYGTSVEHQSDLTSAEYVQRIDQGSGKFSTVTIKFETRISKWKWKWKWKWKYDLLLVVFRRQRKGIPSIIRLVLFIVHGCRWMELWRKRRMERVNTSW